jgi:predicted nucleotidyltransferase component of viral defense system
MNGQYRKQVQLLTRVLPLVAAETCFALKGGTAINLFIRDMPRLSVDIDLVYLPMDERDTALKNIRAALLRISTAIKKAIPDVKVQNPPDQGDSQRLIVENNGVQIKIELSPVLRGTVYPVKIMGVTKNVEDNFGYAEIQVVSLPDLYAGKICAALDRQHPRDLFDVKLLLENEGITEELRKAFLVYLISHNRPIAELLNPNRQDIKTLYEETFVGMTQEAVALEELLKAREQLISGLSEVLTEAEKKFLVSFKAKSPDWSLLGIDGVEKLPAVRWKMLNLTKLSLEKHGRLLENLKSVISNL